jgi:hypothetical protein
MQPSPLASGFSDSPPFGAPAPRLAGDHTPALASLRRPALLLAAALGLAGLGGCVELGDEPVEAPATSETAQALSPFNWTSSSVVDNGVWWPQLVTFGSRVFMVHSSPGYVMKWRERFGTNVWGPATAIPGQDTTYRVSLASFNGFVYMLRTDRATPTRLWLSRFDPATNAWSAAYQLAFTSYGGPPAMVAYNGALQLIGVDPSSKKLWRATMNSSETFSAAVPMDGHYSNSRVSAAVSGCRLYIAHRGGATSTVVYNAFNGSSWDFDRTIPAGPGGAAIQDDEPVIAERSGYLHLLFVPYGSAIDSKIQWTSFDGSSWAPAVQLNQPTTYGPSLTTGGSGLVAVAATYYNSPGVTLEYVQALPSRLPLPCFVLEPPPIFLP